MIKYHQVEVRTVIWVPEGSYVPIGDPELEKQLEAKIHQRWGGRCPYTGRWRVRLSEVQFVPEGQPDPVYERILSVERFGNFPGLEGLW